MNKALFCPRKTVEYKDGHFEAGYVSRSKHKRNKIYLLIKPSFEKDEYIFHLTKDEGLAIISVISETLWSLEFREMYPHKVKFYKLKDLLKRDKKGGGE